MKKEKLIEKLQELPEGIEVCVFDHRKCMHNDSGDGSSEGVHPEFEIEVISIEPEEVEHYKEHHGKDFVPWAALGFENNDYEE